MHGLTPHVGLRICGSVDLDLGLCGYADMWIWICGYVDLGLWICGYVDLDLDLWIMRIPGRGASHMSWSSRGAEAV